MISKTNAGRHHVLGTLESIIMEVIWEKGSTRVREVVDRIGKKRGLAYTTVMTVMNRLCDKGILARTEASGGVYEYSPHSSKEEFCRETTKEFVGVLLRNFGPVAVAHFADALEELAPDQLQLLKEKFSK